MRRQAGRQAESKQAHASSRGKYSCKRPCARGAPSAAASEHTGALTDAWIDLLMH